MAATCVARAGRPRLRLLLLGTSLAALTAASPAAAECSPDPTPTGGTTICTGSDTDGLTVGGSFGAVIVTAGASLQNLAGDTAMTVNGGGNDLRIAQGGSISGLTAIRIEPSNGLSASVSVTNAGTIAGTGGIAILGNLADDPMFPNSVTLYNQASGSVFGSIEGGDGFVSNSGSIDGGARSAVVLAARDPIELDGLVNTAVDGIPGAGRPRIVNASDLATVRIDNLSGLSNYGTIRNDGAGAAIGSATDLRIYNAAGAVIASAGGTAITIDGAVRLTNLGAIAGGVVSNAAGGSSTVDTTDGTISGDIRLGGGDDTLRVRFADGRIVGVTGAIDGGAGLDTISYRIATTETLAGLPTGFERLGLTLSGQASVTLAADATAPDGVVLDGQGGFVNLATLVTAGPAISQLPYSGSTVGVTNRGSITATLGPPNMGIDRAAVEARGPVVNEGSIVAIGGTGVLAQAFLIGVPSLTNSGTIAATGVGVASINGFVNSGTIRSSGDAGITAAGFDSTPSSNSGTIEGATDGIRMTAGMAIRNAGTIRGGQTGVRLASYGRIDNLAGGAIAGPVGIDTAGYSAETIVSNAGRIDGGVLLSEGGGDLFLDLGGTVNGAIRLGAGDDVFVTAFDSDPARPLGGASGGLDAGAGDDRLVYRVTTDSTTVPTPPPGFERLGFEVDEGVTLTLVGGVAAPLTFGGGGTVDLTADIAATDTTALDLSMPTTAQRLGIEEPGEDRATLTLVSRGTIDFAARIFTFNPGQLAPAVRATGARFENAGTIRVATTVIGPDANPFYVPAAISGGEVVNSGTISLSGPSDGVYAADSFVNTGTILGTGFANGVRNTPFVENSGSIVVDAAAVSNEFGGFAINSGTLESRQAAAVQLGRGYGALVNRATGIVRGAGTAIEGDGAVVNEGMIVGSVALGTSGFAFAPSAYIAAGGTLQGDLAFGQGDDLLVLRGPSLGVTGTITDQGGYDTYGVSLTASGTVALDTIGYADFEGTLVEAAGADTVVNVTASRPIGDVTLTGSGTIVNRATIVGTVDTGGSLAYGALTTQGELAGFTNEADITGSVVGSIRRFANTGRIAANGTGRAVAIETYGTHGLAATNAGRIDGTLSIAATADRGTRDTPPTTIGIQNSGTVAATLADANAIDVAIRGDDRATGVDLTNSGLLSVSGQSGDAVAIVVQPGTGTTALSLSNSGTIRSLGDGLRLPDGRFALTSAITLVGSAPPPAPEAPAPGTTTARIVNLAGGTIGAMGAGAVAIRGVDVALDIDNAGLIAGGSPLGDVPQYGAILSLGARDDVVRNSGEIASRIDLGEGADRVENRGAIRGDVLLGGGDDSYLHRSTATLAGIADGGAGSDTVTIEAAGDGGAVAGDRFAGFERLVQVGDGRVDYAGSFDVPTLELAGGTLSVAAGRTLATAGETTVTGGDAGVSVINAGTIAGAVRFGGGADRFVDLPGSSVTGPLDGGAGRDTYEIVLSGDRSLTRAPAGFEQLAATGPGTLTLAAGQAWEAIALAGNGLVLGAGDATARIDGSDAGERVTLAGTAGHLALGDGADELVLLAGGRVTGTADLGAGDDLFSLGTGGRIEGAIVGGAGTDRALVDLTADVAIAATQLREFEMLATSGAGTLRLTGGEQRLDRLDASGTVAIAADAALSVGQLAFGAADNRLIVSGTLQGGVDGGGGSDRIEVSGGSATAPVAFSTIANVEAFAMDRGYATIARTARLGVAELTGGRMIGLAGSTITAATISVSQSATFGSAGTVAANLAVAGTLSPGASPGTMTVVGNVALASGSTALFEITPTASDRLLISGTLSIASGATLQLVAGEPVRPGTSLDLIVADGGIAGSFSTVSKSAGLFGFITQDANRIRLLGQFRNDASLPANARGAIDYVNAVIAGGGATAGFLAALPQLATASGSADAAAFARISPEAYASARQIAVENGLVLADTVRGPGFAAHRDTPGLFASGQALGNWRRLRGDAGAGVARARSDGWGALGGLGWSGGDWSVGGFIGVLDSRQTLARRGARNSADGVVGGVHARYEADGLSMSATLANAGGHGDTRRTVPGGTQTGRYTLRAWTGDVAARYAVDLSGGWSLEPRLGATIIRTTRGGLTETGGLFALSVSRARDTAVFADGGIGIGRFDPAEPIRAHASLGARWQLAGRESLATAALGGGDFSLVASGVERARLLGVAALSIEARVAERVTLFGSASGQRGGGEHDEALRGGLRIDF